MNKEYFVLEIEDTSSAEYRKNYWKKAAEILLERIYQREQCISEKVKNIPQFGITECLIQYKCSENTPPPYAIRSG